MKIDKGVAIIVMAAVGLVGYLFLKKRTSAPQTTSASGYNTSMPIITPNQTPFFKCGAPIFTLTWKGKTYYTMRQAGIYEGQLNNPYYAMPDWHQLISPLTGQYLAGCPD